MLKGRKKIKKTDKVGYNKRYSLSGTDWRDLAMLLLAFPELKQESGEVLDCLLAVEASENILELWRDVVGMAIEPEEDEGY